VIPPPSTAASSNVRFAGFSVRAAILRDDDVFGVGVERPGQHCYHHVTGLEAGDVGTY
jgi:hypothetical protein